FQPTLLHLAEHVSADSAILRAVYAVVLLLLHGEVGPQDLLQRVLFGCLMERVVRPILRHWLVGLRLPGQLLDFLMSLGHTLATHVTPFSSDFGVAGPDLGRVGCSRQPRKSLCPASHLDRH